MSSTPAPLLEVSGLTVELAGPSKSAVRALDGVSFSVGRGQAVGLVGESGCGKSLTALSIMRLLDAPAHIAGGTVRFAGEDLTRLAPAEVRRLRGRRLSMIFQEPMTALNPVYTVGEQVAEVVRTHESTSRRAAWDRAVKMLERVGIPSPAERARSYPHQLSGGMRQRVMIAMALVCGPDLLIADEPTTALDVTVQAQILELLADLRRESGMALLLITHDLGVVAGTCDEVVVMYAGQVVERAAARALFRQPLHPYTAGLLRSIPPFGDDGGVARGQSLREIPGVVPPLTALPPGCRFQTRCAQAEAVCAEAAVPLEARGERQVRCLFEARL